MLNAIDRLPPTIRGIMWMLASCAGYTTMSTLVRLLSADYSSFEIVFARNVVSLALLAPWFWKNGIRGMRTTRFPLHMVRAVFAYLALLFTFYALSELPLSDVTALGFTRPLFIVILAVLILHEKAGLGRWGATALGFLGVLVILRPGFEAVGFATLAVLAGTSAQAISNISIKSLLSTDSPALTLVYVNLIMLALSVVPLAYSWTVPAWADLPVFLGMGVAGLIGIGALTRAYAVADASAVVALDYIRMPMAVASGYFVFGEATDIWTWVGSAIIFAATYLLVRLEGRGGKPRG